MYLCPPSAEAITFWRSILADEVPDVLGELRDAVMAVDIGADAMEDQLWDYTRLFVGPYHLPCPPWESVYRSSKRMLMQGPAEGVAQWYAAAGFVVDHTGVMPDHLGAELNFLALVSGSSDGDSFLRLHVMTWAPQFTADMEAAAETEMYRTLARTTRSALEWLGAEIVPS